MAPSHRASSPYRSRDPVAMYTHHSFSPSPERALSDHETSSDTTLYGGDELSQWSTCPIAPIFDQLLPHSDTVPASAIFPFHLISACSSAERAMCQYSQSTTTTTCEVKQNVGRKGTYRTVHGRASWKARMLCSMLHGRIAYMSGLWHGRVAPPPAGPTGPWRFRHRSRRQRAGPASHDRQAGDAMQEQQEKAPEKRVAWSCADNAISSALTTRRCVL